MKEEKIELVFHGPYKFVNGPDSLFLCDFARSEGIYIWTIKDEAHKINFVHYIGETTAFAKRQRDHLIHITGQNYLIIDADWARQGIEKIVWNGLWRDRSKTAVQTLLDKYVDTSKKVVDYIGIINVYFAPTTIASDIRRHIERCLGWNMRLKYPDLKVFYPDDTIVSKPMAIKGINLKMVLPEDIAGIESEMII